MHAVRGMSPSDAYMFLKQSGVGIILNGSNPGVSVVRLVRSFR